jgi:hypothetical protein
MAALTSNEEAQLAQTIEMFEVITQSQPLDYASLEILKEAYLKLGRQRDVVNTAKRIAQAYVMLGQLSSAILEYESILQQFPDDPDVKAALAEIESKASTLATPGAGLDTEFTPPGETAARTTERRPAADDVDDGRTVMHKLFVESRMIGPSDFDALWPSPSLNSPPNGVTEPFIQLLADKALVPLDKSLRILCEKSRLAFVPLDKYDVDAELARGFPKDICQRWCVLPFDRMSKSIFVATANPFNKQAAWDLETTTRSRLLWYVTDPKDLLRLIRKFFR